MVSILRRRLPRCRKAPRGPAPLLRRGGPLSRLLRKLFSCEFQGLVRLGRGLRGSLQRPRSHPQPKNRIQGRGCVPPPLSTRTQKKSRVGRKPPKKKPDSYSMSPTYNTVSSDQYRLIGVRLQESSEGDRAHPCRGRV